MKRSGKIARRLEVSFALGRELFRALTTPWHLAVYLLTQSRWRERARRAVTAPRDASDPFAGVEPARDRLVQKRPPRTDDGQRHVFLSVGEASGVGHGKGLARAIVDACGPGSRPRFTVFGGPDLVDAIGENATLAYPLSENPQIGVVDVLKNLGFFVRAQATFIDILEDDPPDVVLLVDYPGMHFVMARAAQARRIPVVHYVAPQYWAWGPWRLGRYRKAVDATLTIFPFEPEFFEGDRLVSAYVGHPLVDAMQTAPPDPDATARAAAEPTLVVLPGARRRELRWHLEGMLGIVKSLRTQHRFRCVIIQAAAVAADRTRAALAELPEDVAGGPVEVIQDEPGPWYRGARCVLAKSGTASLEAAVHGAVTVILYRVQGRMFRFVYNHLLTVPMFGGANLAVGREIAPEFAIVDDENDWGQVGDALAARWPDGPTRETAIRDLDELQRCLGGPGANGRAAAIVLPYCRPPV